MRIAVKYDDLIKYPLTIYRVGGEFTLRNIYDQSTITLPIGYGDGDGISVPLQVGVVEDEFTNFTYSYDDIIQVAKFENPYYSQLIYASLELVMLDAYNKVVAYLTTNNTGAYSPTLVGPGYRATIEFGSLPEVDSCYGPDNYWVIGKKDNSSVFSDLHAYKVIPPEIIITPTPTATVTPTVTPSITYSSTPTLTATSTQTPTKTPAPTRTQTTTPTSSITPTRTQTGTATPTSTVTSTPTTTTTLTQSTTPTLTPTSTTTTTLTATQTVTPTATSTQTLTPSLTSTVTPTPSVTNTNTPTVTRTPTVTPTPAALASNVIIWGDNSYGQLGMGYVLKERFVDPPRISDQTLGQLANYQNILNYRDNDTSNSVTFDAINPGSNFTVGVDSSGSLHSAGVNAWGQLGLGNFESKSMFTRLSDSSLNGVVFKQVSLGGMHALALDSNGNMWSWGRNSDGQLGNHYPPRPIKSITTVDSDLFLYDIKISYDVRDEYSLNDEVLLDYYNGTLNATSVAKIWTTPTYSNSETTIRIQWENYEPISFNVVPLITSKTKVDTDPGLLANPTPKKINTYKEYRYCIDTDAVYLATPTPTPTLSVTATTTNTLTVSPTNTTTTTLTTTPTNTSTTTLTSTPTLSITASPTASIGQTPTATKTPTTTPTLTATPTSTVTITATRTGTPTNSPTPSTTASLTPTQTGSPTTTPTNTQTPTVTPTKQAFSVVTIYGDISNVLTNSNKADCLVNIYGVNSSPELLYKVKVLDVEYLSSTGVTKIRIDHSSISALDTKLMKYISITRFSDGSSYEYQTFKRVFAGEAHSLALDSSGRLYGWGGNKYGQLGMGLIQDVNAVGEIVIVNNKPVVRINLTTRPKMINPPPGKGYCYNRGFSWKKISLGRFHSLALDSMGQMWVWGDNDFGQLGLGPASTLLAKAKILQENYPSIGSIGEKELPDRVNTIIPYAPLPIKIYVLQDNYSDVQIPSIETDVWLDIAAGGYHNLAIKKEFSNNNSYGSLWAWGDNSFGQISRVISSPKIISNNPNEIDIAQVDFGVINSDNSRNYWKRVYAGRITSFAVKSTDGQLYSWGESNLGQTGNITNRTALTSSIISIPAVVNLPTIPFELPLNATGPWSIINVSNDIDQLENIGINHLANHMLIIPNRQFPTPTPTSTVTASPTPSSTT